MTNTEIAAGPATASPGGIRTARTRLLLEAPVLPALLRLAAPNIALLAVQAVSSSLDALFVGRLGPQALAGMIDTLRRDQPSLVCEVLRGRGSERPLEQLLGPLGYRYYLLTPDGPVLRERVEGHPELLNYLFTTRVPHEHHGSASSSDGSRPIETPATCT